MPQSISTVAAKMKVQLKLSIARLRMVQQKDEALAKQQRRVMAQLLEQGKEESARIRVENIIRSDINTELLEILELYCELLHARIGIVDNKQCDLGLEEAVKSIIYAAPRTDIKELQQVRQLLVETYGKEFALDAIENRDGKVAERVLKRLRVEPPDPELVTLYLTEIAKTYGVPWPKRAAPVPDENNDNDDQPGGGEGVKIPEPPLLAEELVEAKSPKEFDPSVRVARPIPRTDSTIRQLQFPPKEEGKPSSNGTSDIARQTLSTNVQAAASTRDSGRSKNVVGGNIPDVDELSKRFAALKR